MIAGLLGIDGLAAQVAARARAARGPEELAEALAALDALGRVLAVGGPVGVAALADATGLSETELRSLASRVGSLRAAEPHLRPYLSLAAWLGPIDAPGSVPGVRGEPGWLELAAPRPGRALKAVAEETVLRLFRGQLDGFRASEVAAELARHEAGRAELRLLSGERRAPTRLRLAADAPSPVRDPSAGVVVGRAKKGGVAIEVVRFPSGIVAVYAASPVAIALGKTAGYRAIGAASGYLELEEKKPARKLLLRVGEDSVEVKLA